MSTAIERIVLIFCLVLFHPAKFSLEVDIHLMLVESAQEWPKNIMRVCSWRGSLDVGLE